MPALLAGPAGLSLVSEGPVSVLQLPAARASFQAPTSPAVVRDLAAFSEDSSEVPRTLCMQRGSALRAALLPPLPPLHTSYHVTHCWAFAMPGAGSGSALLYSLSGLARRVLEGAVDVQPSLRVRIVPAAAAKHVSFKVSCGRRFGQFDALRFLWSAEDYAS